MIESVLRVPSLFYLNTFRFPLHILMESETNETNEIRAPPVHTRMAIFLCNFFQGLFFTGERDEMHINLPSLVPENLDNIPDDFFSRMCIMLLSFTCFFIFFGIAFLPFGQLLSIYNHMVALALVCAQARLSQLYVTSCSTVTSDDTSWQAHTLAGCHLAGQLALASLAVRLLGLGVGGRLALGAFCLPVLGRLARLHGLAGDSDTDEDGLWLWHNAAAVFLRTVGSLLALQMLPGAVGAMRALYDRLSRTAWMEGLLAVPLHLWQDYNMTRQLLIFWLSNFCLRLIQHAVYMQDGSGLGSLLLGALSDGCSSPLCVLGLCVTVSHASWLVLAGTRLFLTGGGFGHQQQAAAAAAAAAAAGGGGGGELQRGWAEGFTFLLVAVQTNLPQTMRTPQWASLVTVVAFILVSSLLDSVHEIAGPHLLHLGAAVQSGPGLSGHVRALLVMGILLFAPVYMTVWLLRLFQPDFWLLIIALSCLLTALQAAGSLVLYLLFLYDHYRSGPAQESFEDLVFYVKSSVRLVELLVAMVIVCFGVREFYTRDWSLLSLAILLVHFWFNVVQRVQSGWRKFLLRRMAAKRLSALPNATAEELRIHNDVCAICFGEMLLAESAKRTLCQHYFHPLCLRRWLHIRDTCPMCQQPIRIPQQQEQQLPPLHQDSLDRASQNPQQPAVPSPAEDNRRQRHHDDDDSSDGEGGALPDVSSSTDSEVYRQDDDVDLAVYRPLYEYEKRAAEAKSESSDELSEILHGGDFDDEEAEEEVEEVGDRDKK